LVDVFLRFAQKSFEKWQAAICHISKEFCENLGNVLTNRKKGIKLQKRIVHTACTLCFQKSFINSKAFGVKQLRINKFNILKG
jgi:hypothetical protein